MGKICVIGHFGFGTVSLNGQTIKTKSVTDALKKQYGEDQVSCIDTKGWTAHPAELLAEVKYAMQTCQSIIMLPAHKGVRVFAPLLALFKKIYQRKIFYVVIGGWLPKMVKRHRLLKRSLLKFDGIYVETKTMRRAMEEQDFHNTYVMPNFKNLKVLKPEDLSYTIEQPYKLCTFSRVLKQKGIEDAIHAVKAVNDKAGHVVYMLDIYGQVDPAYQKEFSALTKDFPAYIRYKGTVDYDKTTEVIKDYFALLFPTQFYTEGIPGTIIDAYAAGVPVIASKWESFLDMIDENVTGVGYEFSNNQELIYTLEHIAEDPSMILQMKKNCLIKANEFTPNIAMKHLFENGGVKQKYNFYLVHIQTESHIPATATYKLCTFSRVMKEKGIEEAIAAVRAVNERFGRAVYSLDIYGQVDTNYRERFAELQSTFPDDIRYAGLVSYDKSVATLKSYFALLFPTYYAGEGFAGTLLDAMAAGVPVIASNWKYNKEVVVPKRTGVMLDDCRANTIADALIKILQNPQKWNAMKTTTLDEAKKYLPSNAIQPLLKRIGDN